ncbi:alcohol dehydrogenase (NADP+) [Klebsormidium nitens]|uniref:Alcohol dehydrogenase (NADP+) n=1 Tax=Klebsormidium nitens TaxID=105231 RepID=A0A1Y1HX96_KLENI|nr:alcohol dehydrogenase (NADP+) [Klebsormidium nitens]|eukprot:GAQ83280.1 alcohol dehydrogenase (NADP+) [Klebsormidium nitens]
MALPKTFALNTGASIPAVGLGTWKSEPGKVGESVTAALEAGYRHIDCAAVYGNEKEVGEALAAAFKKGTVNRHEIWVTSKLWSTEQGPGRVEPALKKTLGDLQLEYLDLYLIHIPVRLAPDSPFPAKPEHAQEFDIDMTWKQMEEVLKKGMTKAIGVSNMTQKKLNDVLSLKRTVPAVNQVELHPLWPQDDLLNLCKSKGIHVTAYSPLGSADRPRANGVPEPPVLLDTDVVKKVAEKTKKSPGQVVLRWGIQRGTSVLPKSTNPDRIKQNLDVLDWELSDEDMKALSGIEPKVRILDFKGMWAGEGCAVETVHKFWDGEVTTPADY